MFKFKKQSKELSEKIKIDKRNIKPFIVSLIIALFSFLAFHYCSGYFVNVIWVFSVILLVFLLLIIMIKAGFVVLKSFFVVAAELSLLIFLSQSYCNVSGHSIESDEALKSLLAFGILFIAISFLKSLYEELNKDYKVIKNEPWSKEKIIFMSCYFLFIYVFIWNICLVMIPILSDLCVYK